MGKRRFTSVHDFLSQTKITNTLINNKLREREMFYELATALSGAASGPVQERVKASSDGQKMAKAVENMADIDKEIDGLIDRLIEQKKEILQQIEQLQPAEYDILHKLYIQGMDLHQAAEAYTPERSYSWAYKKKEQATASLLLVLQKNHIL